MKLDHDLESIQWVRQFLAEAREAQQQLARLSQSEIDAIVLNMCEAACREAERLGRLAAEETGFGVAADKTIKNLFAARDVYAAIKEMKTVGIIRRDEAARVWEVAEPVGIVAGITPSTNPTSTIIFKSMIAIKARNAIIFSPHPAAARCSLETALVMRQAAEQAGAPKGLIHCLSQPTLAATRELMTHKETNVILATGGAAMVRAAYSSGKPAFGVGPGNVPVYLHPSADLALAVKRIIASKTFDNGTICASEQALVADLSIKERVKDELKRQGAFFLKGDDKERVARLLVENGSLNPRVVGQAPDRIANMAGISIPSGTRVLIAEEEHVGKAYPFSIEKLSPILAFYTVADWQEGAKRCRELLHFGGLGHTLGLHCEDMNVIEAFAREQPASRIVVNTGTTFGGIGATTGIQPSMTLGCGSFGNNSTSDNIGPQHLLNLKRVAFGIKEMAAEPSEEQENRHEEQANPYAVDRFPTVGISRDEVVAIIRRVLAESGANT